MTDIKTTGALFINDKQGNPSRPDYQGDFKLTPEFLAAITDALGDGNEVKIRLSGWKKQGQKGPYLSLSIQPPFRSDGQSRPTERIQGGVRRDPPRDDLDSEIPF